MPFLLSPSGFDMYGRAFGFVGGFKSFVDMMSGVEARFANHFDLHTVVLRRDTAW